MRNTDTNIFSDSDSDSDSDIKDTDIVSDDGSSPQKY